MKMIYMKGKEKESIKMKITKTVLDLWRLNYYE